MAGIGTGGTFTGTARVLHVVSATRRFLRRMRRQEAGRHQDLADTLPRGRHRLLRDDVVVWNGTDRSGRNVASGVYFSSLRTGEGTVMQKMLLMK